MECKKCIQVAVNGVLAIPDDIPNFDFILRVTSTPIIDNAIVLDKQISFSGHVLICVEMVSSQCDCPQTVFFTSFEAPFIGLIDHHCARAGMDAQLNASIKHQDFKNLSCKCISKLIVVKVCILRLTKSCKPLNAHCSEPRLTLLCKPPKPPTSHCDKQHGNIVMHSTDDHNDLTDFHLPQSLQPTNAGYANNQPCSICGGKIDHTEFS